MGTNDALRKAIRRKCLECVKEEWPHTRENERAQQQKVDVCCNEKCPLWWHRMGGRTKED